MFSFLDKRLSYLKKQKSKLADTALMLYNDDEGNPKGNYLYFLGASNSDPNDWNAYKDWILKYVLVNSEELRNDKQLLDFYIQYVNPATENAKNSIKNFWNNNGPDNFNKKNEFSGFYFMFAAYVWMRSMNFSHEECLNS